MTRRFDPAADALFFDLFGVVVSFDDSHGNPALAHPHESEALSAMKHATVESIVRFVPLTPSLATAGQPSEAQLAALAAAGFELVINLALHDDPRYSLNDEAATVAALGMQYVHIPVRFSAPTLADLAEFVSVMEHTRQRKVFVHCAHNKRVPVFIALYRIAKQGWPESAALAAMREVWVPDATWENFILQALRARADWRLSETDLP